MSEHRLYRLAGAGSISVVVVLTAWLLLDLGGPDLTKGVESLAIAAAAFLAAAACFRAARRGAYGFGRAWTIALRRAWRFLGAAATVWGTGQLVWFGLDLATGDGFPYPSAADAFFLLAIPLVAIGVLSYPTAPVRALAQARTLLDGVLIASSLLFVSWAVVLGATYRAGGGPVLPRAICLAYPIGDIVTGTIAFSVLARTRGRAVVQPTLLAAAVLAMGVADSGFAYLVAKGSYHPGQLVDLGWLASHLLFLVAALRPVPAALTRDDDDGERAASWPRMLLPYLPPALALLTAVVVQLTTGRLEPFLVFNLAAMALFVIARQVVVIAENQQLNRRLRGAVERKFQREAELDTALRREYAAADRLRAMSEMKDTFLRAVSHDLRTPLTAMLGVSVTLERTKLNLPREQALDLIRMLTEKSRKMDRLLGDLLDLNRMEEGILEPKRALTDVRALAHRVVSEVDQLRGWPIEIDAEPVQAAVDAGKVERIIENLLLNTTRHTPPGTRVWVRALARGRDLVLIVEDAGPGVPAELAGTIFEPFRQGPHPDADGDRQTRGVGIGLSLVARFAQLHGGRAWVAERQGGGASFQVLLPGCIKQEQVATPTRPPATPEPTRILDPVD